MHSPRREPRSDGPSSHSTSGRSHGRRSGGRPDDGAPATVSPVGQWSDEPSDPWLSGRPAERATSGDLTLDRAHPDDLEELVDSVNSSLDELRPWMPWA